MKPSRIFGVFIGFVFPILIAVADERSAQLDGPLDLVGKRANVALELTLHQEGENLYLDAIVRNHSSSESEAVVTDPFHTNEWPQFLAFRIWDPEPFPFPCPFPNHSRRAGESHCLRLFPGGFCGRRFRIQITPPPSINDTSPQLIEYGIQAVGYDGIVTERQGFNGPKLSGEIVIRSKVLSLGKHPPGSHIAVGQRTNGHVQWKEPLKIEVRHFLRSKPDMIAGENATVDFFACNYSAHPATVYDPRIGTYGFSPSPFGVSVTNAEGTEVHHSSDGLHQKFSSIEAHRPSSVFSLPADAICGRAMPWLFVDKTGEYQLSVRIRQGAFADVQRILHGPRLDQDSAVDEFVHHKYRVVER